MDYTYKRLGKGDIELFKELIKLFSVVFEDEKTYQGNVPSDEYLKDLLAKSDFIPMVALDKETVIGGLVAYELKKFEQKRSEVYIYDLGVLESHRRKGVATDLINALKPIAKDLGAWTIFVQADKGDDPAIKLYESLGAREDVLHFDIPVT